MLSYFGAQISLLQCKLFANQPSMTKQDPPKRKGPGRPYKGRLKVTLRLSQETVDALESSFHYRT
jgi:hypothetical protein